MIDLHIHLDGSLGERELNALAAKQNAKTRVTYPSSPPDPEGGLKAYLERFRLPLSLLQSPESVYHAIMLLAERLEKEGLEYAEIRFAPSLSTDTGATQSEIVSAASYAAKKTFERGFPIGIILCCMRGGERDANLETLRLAEEYVKTASGIVAIDLAGDEGRFPTEDYRYIFDRAREKGIPFTIHAGEAGGAESVRAALDMGTKRLGHGVRAVEDPETLRRIISEMVTLELCYTSNLQTGAWKGGEYPLRRLMAQGVAVTLNTDNTAVSATTLRREYDLLAITAEEREILSANARKAAFKNKLLEND